MLERFAVSIAATTILAVLGKLALIYHDAKEAGQDWLVGPVEQPALATLLLSLFLIFFRGKMMHDDATFFSDLARAGVFKTGTASKYLIKLGLLLGYFSWLLWAPALYFLDDLRRFSGFLIASFAVSTVWLVIDILTRATLEWRRAFWIVPNVFYVGFLVLLIQPEWATVSVLGLLAVLVVDWLVTDPLSGHV